jgi:hypothetical protein
MLYLVGHRGDFAKLTQGSETLGILSEGLVEMFEGDFADTYDKNVNLK